MSGDIPDQVVLAGFMAGKDAQLLLRILNHEHAKAHALAAFIRPEFDAAPRHPGVQARQRLVEFVGNALLRAGRKDLLDSAL